MTTGLRLSKKNVSTFVVATLVFAFVNIVVSAITTLERSDLWKESSRVDECIDTAVAQYKAAPTSIVMLGSSVVMSALWCTDKTIQPDTPDFFHDHHGYLLEKYLHEKGGTEASVASLAVPGAMVSDQYLLAKNVVQNNAKTKLLVFGIAPRDFLDDLMVSESASPVFRHLATFDEISQNSNLYATNAEQLAEIFLDRTVALYGKRSNEQRKMSQLLSRLGRLERTEPTDDVGAKLVAANPAHPASAGQTRDQLWKQSQLEYSKRYQKFNQIQFAKQKTFLNSLLAFAQTHSLKIVLVEMPLTATNRKLMPESLATSYNQVLESAAKKFSVPLFRPEQLRTYSDNEFLDTVHLNEKGGQILWQQLADFLKDHEIVD